MFQKTHAIRRIYPVVGRLRYVMEELRPKMYQYFIELDIDGRPFNRLDRSSVYQRAKNVRDTIPFGTQLDLYAEGYDFFFQAEDGIRDGRVTGVQTCALPILPSMMRWARPALARPQQGALHPAAVVAPRGRPLLQPPRPAHHRRQDGGSEGVRARHPDRKSVV